MTASFKAVMIGGVRWYQQHISQTHRLVASIIQRARIMPLRHWNGMARQRGSARRAEITALPAVESWGNRRCSTTVFRFLQVFVVEGS